MVPPEDIGAAPIWVGVYVALILSLAVSGYLFYYRVIRLIRQARGVARFDHPLQGMKGALVIVLGQRRVLQRVPARDWAGLSHGTVFWGFLSFALSYVIFIFTGSAWQRPQRSAVERAIGADRTVDQKEEKRALAPTGQGCHWFVANQVRLLLLILASNLSNLLRRLALPEAVNSRSLRSLQAKLIKS